MNLKENKILTLALIEEYNPDSEFLSDDEDIIARLNSIYNACLMNLARQKRIERTYTYDDRTETTETMYEEFSLPADWYMIRDILVQDSETNSIKSQLLKSKPVIEYSFISLYVSALFVRSNTFTLLFGIDCSFTIPPLLFVVL